MDINKIRKLAGLDPKDKPSVLTERLDDFDADADVDDELSPAERALVAKAESDLAKKGIKIKDVDPEKDLASLAAKEKTKEVATPAAKQEPKQKQTDVKTSSDNAASRGRKPSDKTAAAREYFTKHNPTRGEFIRYVVDHLGMSVAHGNTLYYTLKKRLSEFYVVKLSIGDKVIAEHSSFDKPTWVDYNNVWQQDAMIFESERAAMKVVVELRKNGVNASIKKIAL